MANIHIWTKLDSSRFVEEELRNQLFGFFKPQQTEGIYREVSDYFSFL